MRNLHLTFDYSTYSQKLGEDFEKNLWPSQNIWTLIIPIRWFEPQPTYYSNFLVIHLKYDFLISQLNIISTEIIKKNETFSIPLLILLFIVLTKLCRIWEKFANSNLLSLFLLPQSLSLKRAMIISRRDNFDLRHPTVNWKHILNVTDFYFSYFYLLNSFL